MSWRRPATLPKVHTRSGRLLVAAAASLSPSRSRPLPLPAGAPLDTYGIVSVNGVSYLKGPGINHVEGIQLPMVRLPARDRGANVPLAGSRRALHSAPLLLHARRL